jgi:hypoxanthine phosphoribosyltransferase
MEYELGEVLLTRSQIASGVSKIAQEISKSYANDRPIVISLLVGAFVFCADLVREIGGDCLIEFIKAKSYQGSNSSGNVIISGLDALHLENKSVLLVEDIIDTGLTLNAVLQQILAKKPKSVKVATLLDKPSRRKVNLKPDYVCFSIPDHFVVGYGLDYDNKYRNLPDIHMMRMK